MPAASRPNGEQRDRRAHEVVGVQVVLHRGQEVGEENQRDQRALDSTPVVSRVPSCLGSVGVLDRVGLSNPFRVHPGEGDRQCVGRGTV